MSKNSRDFSMQEAMRLANSEAGQQLLALMKAQNGEALDHAMEQAAAGDYTRVRESLSAMLASPQVRALLEQLGRDSNG